MSAIASYELYVNDRRWYGLIDRLQQKIALIVKQCRTVDLALPGCIFLGTDRDICDLNFRFRGKNIPTNVLTFPYGFNQALLCGDVVLSLQTLKREASQAQKPPSAHLAHLLIHGILHLNGYDHHHPGEARRMEMRESKLCCQLGYPNPWKLNR